MLLLLTKKLKSSMKTKSLFILCVATLISFLPLSAAKYYLYNGIDPWGTRSDGTKVSVAAGTFHTTLNGYSASDEIWIAQGTYTTSISPATIIPKAGMLIYGGFYGNEISLSQRQLADETGGNGIAEPWEFKYPTIINGTGTVDILATYAVFTSTTSYTLDGITIDGHITGNRYGGAIYSTTNSPLISNCIIRNINQTSNTTSSGGAGIYAKDKLNVENCLIENCTTSTGNTSAGGGAIYADKSIVVKQCVLRNNSSNNSGGAILIYGTADVSNTGLIANNLIYNNVAKFGGAIMFRGSAAPYYAVVNNTIVNNTVTGSGTSNYAGGVGNIPSNAVFYNNIFYNNCYANGTVSNLHTSISTGVIDLQYTAYNGGVVAASGGTFGTMGNVTTFTPYFVNASTTKGYTVSMPSDVKSANFALQSSSTDLIDKGGELTNVPSNDIMGNVRPNGITANDIGAYEYYAPTVSLSATSLTGFNYSGIGPSSEQSFTVSGLNLVSTISVTPSENFEVSTTSGFGFQSTAITLTQTNIGNVDTKTIYVRLKAGLSSANYNNENIIISATNSNPQNVVCSGSITSKYYLYSGVDPWGVRLDGTKLEVTAGTLHTVLNGFEATDEVWIAKGTYATSTSPSSIVLKEGMKVYGGFYGNETSVEQRQLADENGGNGVVEPWEFKYPTIINGTGTAGSLANYVMFESGTSYVLNGITIDTHYVNARYGGAIYSSSASATPLISNCIFRNINKSFNPVSGTTTGGGTVAYFVGSPTIASCLFENNLLTIIYTTATANTSYGGTIYLFKSATITGNMIRNNSVNGNSTYTLTGSAINLGGNTDTNTGLIANNVIHNNTSRNAVIYFASGGTAYNVINNTIVNNYASGGNSSYVAGIAGIPANAKLYNNVVYNNAFTNMTTFRSFYSTVTVDLQNCAYNGSNVGVNGVFTGSNNNASLSAPDFVNPSITIGYTTPMPSDVRSANFALQSSSTDLINKGGLFNGISPSNDILENTRPTATNSIDIGAYESSNQNISDYADNGIINISRGGHLTINTSKTLKSINVAPGAKLTITSGNILTTINGINLQSDASGTATLVDNTIDVPQAITATVQQYVEAGRNWYMSIPLASGLSSLFNKGTSVVCYDEPSGYWISPIDNNLDIMRGYIQTATSTPSVTGTTGNIEFTGVLNTGAHSINLTRTAGKTGFNLVGNPYPSYLNWNSVIKTNVSNTMWLRTKEGGVYKFYTYNTIDGASGIGVPATVTQYIPPMQAFWVRVNTEGTGSLAVDNNMRSHKDVTGNILKAPAINTQQLLRLQVSNGINTDETVIYFNGNASDTFDKYDAQKRTNGEPTVPEIFTEVGQEQLVINGMKEVKYNTEIPIGFRTGEANNFSISANEISNFETGTRVILIDKLNPIAEVELSDGVIYNFSSQATTSTTNRFSLLFRIPKVVTEVNNTGKVNVQVFVNADNQITIISPEKAMYSIYNAMGQMIENGVVNSKLITLPITIGTKLNSGVYLVKVNNQSTRVIVK